MENLRKYNYIKPNQDGTMRNIIYTLGGIINNNTLQIAKITQEKEDNGNVVTSIYVNKVGYNENTLWKKCVRTSLYIDESEYDWTKIL